MFTIDNLPALVLPFAIVCYIGLAWWYNSAMKKIERRHDAEMKRITDNYAKRMQEIQADYEDATAKATNRYKKACLKYDLMRTIKE